MVPPSHQQPILFEHLQRFFRRRVMNCETYLLNATVGKP